jgi:FMN-dependent NADH-azoreductase
MHMSTLLHLDASANPGSSVSRLLTGEFAAAWQAARPVSAVIHRDLGLHPPAPLDRDLLAALWAGPGQELAARAQAARAASDALADEFLAADAFVLGVPMYNFSVPAGFKAWLDHVIRFGRTMTRGPKGSEPVVKGRKAVVVATRAADFGKGGAREGMDFVEPYLRAVLGYAGLETEIVTVVNNGAHGDNAARIEAARDRLAAVLARWTAADAKGKEEGDGRAAA